MKKILKLLNKKYIKIPAIIITVLFVLGIASYFLIQSHIINSTKSYISKDITALPECDAVMILGALVYSDTSVSPIVADRLEYGYELYTNGKAKKILISGDHGQENYDEVNAMMNYLLEKGVPREDIFMDHAGFNTYDSMYRARDIFQIETMLISTQDFHINRAVYIARSMGIDAYGYPCEDKSIYKMNYLNRRERLARVKAFVETITKRKPKYLGPVIPIQGNGIVTDG